MSVKFIEGQLADFALLVQDFFTIPDEEIKNLYSVMTVLSGEISLVITYCVI
jgi:predicted amidohydrolase YtcJ